VHEAAPRGGAGSTSISGWESIGTPVGSVGRPGSLRRSSRMATRQATATPSAASRPIQAKAVRPAPAASRSLGMFSTRTSAATAIGPVTSSARAWLAIPTAAVR